MGSTLRFRHEGQRFSRLLVLRHTTWGNWECKCDCGNIKVVNGAFLRNGKTKSCGCLHAEGMIPKHGKSLTPEYKLWVSMIQRCENPNEKRFADYGGRGIKVCERWRTSFADYLADMGGRPSSAYSIDRKDVNGDYEPSNCHWILKGAQQRNRRHNRTLTFGGKTKLLVEWAEETGIHHETIRARIRYGWTPERVLTAPVQTCKGHRQSV